jgi:hypothetical protein
MTPLGIARYTWEYDVKIDVRKLEWLGIHGSIMLTL